MTTEELVALCKRGEGQALGLLYERYAERMCRICLQYITDGQTADDLLHDGFIVVFTSISMLRSPEKLEAWMGKIFKNLSLQYLEHCRYVDTVPLEDVEDTDDVAVVPQSPPFPPYSVMLEMIETLPKGYGQVFRLAVLEGLSHKEIGRLLSIAPHSSSSQLSRAKDMLRQMILRYRIVAGLVVLFFVVAAGVYLYLQKYGDVAEPERRVVRKDEEIEAQDTIVSDTVKDESVAPMLRREHDVTDVKDATKLAVAEDIVAEETEDSIASPVPERMEEKVRPAVDYAVIDENTEFGHKPMTKNGWSVALSYSGGSNWSGTQRSMIPGDITSGIPKEQVEKSRHHAPLTLSLALQKKLGGRWSIETGVQYTYLRSEYTTINTSRTDMVQRVKYVGIPIKGRYDVWTGSGLSVYASAGIALDIPVSATSESVMRQDGHIVSQTKKDLSPALQWSAHLGMGVQYNISPSVGIYAEPNVQYYFNTGNDVRTIRTEKPFTIAVPIGLRLSW